MFDRSASADAADATADANAESPPEAQADPGARRVLVLINRASGTQHPDREARVRAALDAAGLGARARIAPTAPDALTQTARRAAAEGVDIVAACGGDGTIAAVAEGLSDTPAALGVLPAGTFNYFARGLGIPEDLEGAARILAAGAPRPITTGEVNGRLFLNNASLGVYPVILRERERIYARFGRSRISAYWSVLRTILQPRRPLEMVLRADGREERLRTPLAFIANSAFQLDLMGIDGAEAVRGGKLALLLAPDAPPMELLRRATRLGAGVAEHGPDYRLIPAQQIEIIPSRRRRLLARDGERERMSGPFRFRARHDALRVALPADAPTTAAEAQ